MTVLHCSPYDFFPRRVEFKKHGRLFKLLYKPVLRKLPQISTRNGCIQLNCCFTWPLWQVTYLESLHRLFGSAFSSTFWGASIIAVLKEELNPLSKTRCLTGVQGNQYHSPSHPSLRSGLVPKQTGKRGSNKHPGTSPKRESCPSFSALSEVAAVFFLHRWLRADWLNSRFALLRQGSPAKNKKVIVSLLSEEMVQIRA